MLIFKSGLLIRERKREREREREEREEIEKERERGKPERVLVTVIFIHRLTVKTVKINCPLF